MSDESAAQRAKRAPQTHSVELRCALDIPIVPIRWLWKGWLARGKFHLLAGAPGTGKTTIAMRLAASVSNGGQWPDGTSAPAGSVLIWSGEDDPGDTLVPRLKAAGAELSNVHFISDAYCGGNLRAFDPAQDIPALVRKAKHIGNLSLIVCDPVVNAVSGDSHKNTEVRRALGPLVEMADRLGAAVLGITHFSKGSAGRDPTERVVGSVAFSAIARVVMVAAKRAEGERGPERILARAKSNIGSDGDGFGYELQQVDVGDGVQASVATWRQPLNGTARELLGAAEEVKGIAANAINEAEVFLRDILSDGPVASTQVKSDAASAGIAWASVRRAKTGLGVVASKLAMDGGWQWKLPELSQPTKALKNDEGAQ